jgi:hypothetical protein
MYKCPDRNTEHVPEQVIAILMLLVGLVVVYFGDWLIAFSLIGCGLGLTIILNLSRHNLEKIDKRTERLHKATDEKVRQFREKAQKIEDELRALNSEMKKAGYAIRGLTEMVEEIHMRNPSTSEIEESNMESLDSVINNIISEPCVSEGKKLTKEYGAERLAPYCKRYHQFLAAETCLECPSYIPKPDGKLEG